MENTKVWIFQSNRTLSSEEETKIKEIISNFMNSWNAHGESLKSELEILYRKFIIIKVDEQQAIASGCSIDSLHQCIRQIDAMYKLDLLNRLLVSYDEGSEIKTLSINDFKRKVQNGELSSDTYIYNLSISEAKDFKEKFKQPIKESWAKSYLS